MVSYSVPHFLFKISTNCVDSLLPFLSVCLTDFQTDSLSPSLSFSSRALTGASLWAELSIDESIHDALDTASTVDDFFNQYGNNVSYLPLSFFPPSVLHPLPPSLPSLPLSSLSQSDLYNEAMQNMYLDTLEQALQEQTPQPAEEIEDVYNLQFANDMIGTVFSDIDAAVGPFDLDQVIDRAEEAVEGFR